MRCPNCHAAYVEEDVYCRQCGADLIEGQTSSTSIVPAQTRLPALLQNTLAPRRVAAGVGALALGVGLELLRRGLLARLARPVAAESVVPIVQGIKDMLSPQDKKPGRPPKGYEVRETIVLVQRVTRRVN